MTSTRGILRPRAGFEHFELDRAEPPDDLRHVLDRLWTVAWDLPPGQEFEQEILPFPHVNMAFDEGALKVHGPAQERFVRVLSGRGWASGVRFRPAGFFALSNRPMRDVADRVFPAADVTGAAAPPCPSGPEEARQALLDYVRAGIQNVDSTEIVRVNLWVEQAQDDRTITSAADLARFSGVSLRTLQRMLEKYVGVSSQWIVRRARVQQCAELVAQGESVNWAQVAQSLGYHDQAHLIRDFKRQIGFTPAAYAESCRRRG